MVWGTLFMLMLKKNKPAIYSRWLLDSWVWFGQTRWLRSVSITCIMCKKLISGSWVGLCTQQTWRVTCWPIGSLTPLVQVVYYKYTFWSWPRRVTLVQWLDLTSLVLFALFPKLSFRGQTNTLCCQHCWFGMVGHCVLSVFRCPGAYWYSNVSMVDYARFPHCLLVCI